MISFGYPEYLWGFLLLLIPILIHLLRFRKQQVLKFPGVYRLISLLKETQSTRKFNYYILLTNRLLLFSALVMAFAQPSCQSQSDSIPSNEPSVGIIWDATPSMWEADANGVIPAERAKNSVLKWLKMLPESASIYWLDKPYQPKLILTRSEVLEKLNLYTEPIGFYNIATLLKTNEISKNAINWWVISDLDNDAVLDFSNWIDSQSNYHFVDMELDRKTNFSIDTAYCSDPLLGVCKVLISRTNTEGRAAVSMGVYANNRLEGNIPISFQDKMRSVVVECELPQLLSAQNRVKLILPNDAYSIDNELFLSPVRQNKIKVYIESDAPVKDIYHLINTLNDRVVLVDSLSKCDVVIWVPTGGKNVREPALMDRIRMGKSCVVIPFNSNNTALQSCLTGGSWERLKPNQDRDVLDYRGFRQAPFEASLEEYLDAKNVLPSFDNLFKFPYQENREWSRIIITKYERDFLVRRDLGEGNIWLLLADYSEGMKELRESSWFVGILAPIILSSENSANSVCAFWGYDWIAVPNDFAVEVQDAVIIENGQNKWGTSLGINNGELCFTGIKEEYMRPNWYKLMKKDGSDSTVIALNSPRSEMCGANVKDVFLTLKNVEKVSVDNWISEGGFSVDLSRSNAIWPWLIFALLITELLLSNFVLRTNR